MGFDLHFFTRHDRSIDPRELVLWSQQAHFLNASLLPDGLQLLYENPDTGVTFSLDYLPGRALDEGAMGADGYLPTGIGFSLYYGRPTYFGYEAMPFLVDLAHSFDLRVLNPQNGGTQPEVAKAEDLIVSWSACNRQAVRAMAEEGLIDSFFYLPKEKADHLWGYRLSKPRRAALLKGEVHFPQIFLFAPKDGRQCATAIAWNGTAMAFPPVDYVIFVRTKKSLFGLRQRVECIEYAAASTVLEVLRAGLTPLEEDDDLFILTPEQVERYAGEMSRIAGKPLSSAFTRVPYDAFVDVDFLSDEPVT